ncbi:MAG: hypothetical protein WCA90_00135 [Ilumatobacteraceae bacterium]
MPVAVAALVLVVWIALGVVVIGLVNVAKWTVRTSTRVNHVDVPNTTTWPAPQPTSTLEPASAAGGSRAHAAVGRVGLEPTTPR